MSVPEGNPCTSSRGCLVDSPSAGESVLDLRRTRLLFAWALGLVGARDQIPMNM